MTSGLGKKILILDCDIYKNVGGGQSAYKRLISQRPNDSFYYFLNEETLDAPRAPNSYPIKYEDFYYGNMGDLPSEMGHFYNCYLQAWQFAASAYAALGPVDFDVVDGPDYRFDTLFIRGALRAHGIGCDQISLAMHGNITSVFKRDWSGLKPDSRLMSELTMREHFQYRAADSRYSISAFYADRWSRRTGIHPNMVDPLCMIPPMEPALAEGATDAVDLLYIGRRERCKGPDLFVDLAWCVPKDVVNRVRMIGPDATGFSGVGAMGEINRLVRNRGMELDVVERLPHSELEKLYRSKAMLILPARYETFNLVVLEALRFGCPTFVGAGAGVARWIRETLPELSDLVLDLSCSRAASQVLSEAARDYDGFRARLVDTLAKRNLVADMSTLESAYTPSTRQDRSARYRLDEINQRFDSFNRPREFADLPARARLNRYLSRNTPKPIKDLIKQTKDFGGGVRSTLSYVRHLPRHVYRRAAHLTIERLQLSSRAALQVREAKDIESARGQLLTIGERSAKDVGIKLSAISGIVSHSLIARSQVFGDMARLERKRPSGAIIAATYQLRIMRWLNEDRFNQLGFVTETLRENNFNKEADVAEAMFGAHVDKDARCLEILNEQYRLQLIKPDLPLAILDDRRTKKSVKVSIISSLYNAENKLRTFLDNIASQSFARSGQLEIVLVDSNSPTKEYDVFKSYADTHSIPIVFARSAERETIQAAWNRGIKLARGEYLCFLGVDEGMHPDCLDILSRTLDSQPDVDWVIADSIVTNVDKSGVLTDDVMVYNRSDYDHLLVYLDTCYLNWVGGMYRKSIHDRFGYYDETFRAAGDTEFKLRIARHIKSIHVPLQLGVFNNYPEERTTQHPRAEIEDLRAWYLPRSTPGMRYLFDGRSPEIAKDLLRRSLAYRKSYFTYKSTDFDLANSIAQYLCSIEEEAAFGEAALKATNAMLNRIRSLETINLNLSPFKRQRGVLGALVDARKQELSDQQLLGMKDRPKYEIFNDNRYEQHWWSWSA